VPESQIQQDMQLLAGRLAHRAANTDNERVAAEYIRDRLREYAPDAALDDFYSPDNPWYLFASYYAEFTVVSVLAIWWPRVALCYGAVVFLAYLAEFMGYRVMGRFVPQFETQNVVARFLAPRPERQLVVMAHYDSGTVGPLAHRPDAHRLRTTQLAVVACMVVVIFTCALQAVGAFDEDLLWYNTAARWTAAVGLLGAAAMLAYAEGRSEYSRGANDNASGVAALLRLAQRFAERPIESADVYLVATGSNQTWMNGARHFVKMQALDRHTAYFLNLDGVGAGDLRYTTAEGMLHMAPCDDEMIRAARAEASSFQAEPCRLRTACSDALIPLARGYKTIEITAVDESIPAPTDQPLRDTLVHVDYDLTARAADFAEAVLRRLAATP